MIIILSGVAYQCRGMPASAGIDFARLKRSGAITTGASRAAATAGRAGEVVIELFADKAPNTVNSFVCLAQKGFFDGSTFHRVVPDFIGQGGDRTGTGAGGPCL